jgi:hypothetical protein
MSLNYYRDTVAVSLIDDTQTDARMGRIPTATVSAAAVQCRVNECNPTRPIVFGREETEHSHKVQFKRDPHVTVSHLLNWIPPGDTDAIVLQIMAQRRPRMAGMPWVVFTKAYEAGPTP